MCACGPRRDEWERERDLERDRLRRRGPPPGRRWRPIGRGIPRFWVGVDGAVAVVGGPRPALKERVLGHEPIDDGPYKPKGDGGQHQGSEDFSLRRCLQPRDRTL